MKRLLLFSLFLWGFLNVQARDAGEEENAEKDRAQSLEEVVIATSSLFSSDKSLNRLGGSYLLIGPKEIQSVHYSDVNRLFKGKSGVHLYEEEGWGLKPNISIRGSAAGRSSGVNLMEDGILAAPAPYSGPAAYYFPTIGRMQSVEVLKGSGQIMYGPNTVGGNINFISTQIPKKYGALADVAYGMFNTLNVHAMAGGTFGGEHFGLMAEYFKQSSDGFQKFQDGTTAGSLDFNDVVAKALIDYSHGNVNLGKLQFKFQQSWQKDDASYTGVTKEDFKANPFERYIGTKPDGMEGGHRTLLLSYELKPVEGLKITVDGYLQTFSRKLGRGENFLDGRTSSINSVLRPSGSSNARRLGFLKGLGSPSGMADTLRWRLNDRIYHSNGVQLNADYTFGDVKNIKNTLFFGVRYHQDDADRFESYKWLNVTQSGTQELSGKQPNPGGAGDRIDKAAAFSGYLQWHGSFFEKFSITAGLRYEHITVERIDYKSSKDRASRAAPSSSRKNVLSAVLIPGISLAYTPLSELTIFAGVHRGFRPPQAIKNQKEENSLNYELGVRYVNDVFHAEAIGYVNNYTNMLGVPLSAVDALDQNNQGAALVAGLEAAAGVHLFKENTSFSLPLSLDYTFFHGTYTEGFKPDASTKVEKGSLMQLIPTHQLRLNLGFNVLQHISLNFSARYQTEVTTSYVSRRSEDKHPIPAVFVMDAQLNVHLLQFFNTTGVGILKETTLYMAVQNLTNNTYLASTLPRGYRPGMPFFLKAGIRVRI